MRDKSIYLTAKLIQLAEIEEPEEDHRSGAAEYLQYLEKKIHPSSRGRLISSKDCSPLFYI